ncbi:MAG TPA: helix-turn-helix transcriptional regulator [Candidatus Deferrimicrobium sp.]|jgi:HTH-type transcriptional regulator/antitoxin HipB|nr:helix-turn-helix transcriptional regulator [Candidatus Deferrimicrobium sp.]
MKTYRQHLNEKLKDKQFKQLYDEEREMLELSMQVLNTRKNLGMSQDELARKAHITQQQLSRIESGMNYTLSTLLKVCQVLQVKLNLVQCNTAVGR